jgi:hypothetical protein
MRSVRSICALPSALRAARAWGLPLTLAVALAACDQSVPSVKNDAGDAAFEVVNPAKTFWQTTDFKTDTKLQLNMDGSGMEFDTEGNATQMFSWDALTPSSIEIFNCSTTCVMRGLGNIAFSTADRFTATVLPANAATTNWKLVQSSTFP